MLRVLFILFLTACAHRPPEPKQSQNANAIERSLAQVQGAHYASLEFEKGKTSLSDMSKTHLNELAALANRDGREIAEIKIVAWADQEYPDKAQKKAPPKAVILAKKRAAAIKEYLVDDLHAEEKIDSFNMAKRPGTLNQLFQGEDAKVKAAFEEIGPTATRLDDGSLSYSKASKALVIIDYQDDNNQ